MSIEELQRNWDEFGRNDPLWAILTEPGKRRGKWNLREFFEKGEEDIANLMRYIDSLEFPLRRNRALDFGCGVGRLTQPLCRHFEVCYGVDIAPSMIELANKYNRYGQKCRYCLNVSDKMNLFDDNYFDLVYSIITLQHMEPRYSLGYIREFIRILAPGGLLIFQIPSEPIPLQSQDKNATDRPLPDYAFKADLATDTSEITAEPGAEATIVVKVRNLSNVVWPASPAVGAVHEIRLGNHWLDARGRLLARDDGRASLPSDLGPGQEIEIPLSVTIPARPGKYLLELDMVQESIAWFADKGSKTTRVRVEVRDHEMTERALADRDANPPETPPVVAVPRMAMHCVHRVAVLRVIRETGAEIVDAFEDHAVGDAWRSYRYAVTKYSKT
jgi:SAM-dependent methyltransferase